MYLLLSLCLLQVRHIQYTFYSWGDLDAAGWIFKTKAIWVSNNISAVRETGLQQRYLEVMRDIGSEKTCLLHDKTDMRCNDCAREMLSQECGKAWGGGAYSSETYSATRLHGVTGPKIYSCSFATQSVRII
jgi:hypothetical protein